MENLNLDNWLHQTTSKLKPKDRDLVERAITLAKMAHDTDIKPINESITTADTLHRLNLDGETLAAAILYNTIKHSDLTIEDIKEHLGEKTAKLILGVKQMSGVGDLYNTISNASNYQSNVDNIRKMFLAMVDDIRVVLIKLADHLCTLKNAAPLPEQIKKQIAEETMAIYAPLTNRLGIAQIKWELEDISFQYLEPITYKKIKSDLEKYFPESNEYIEDVKNILQDVLTKSKIKNFKIAGRAKHIYSIHRKMNRKKIGLEDLYDISAMRIFVPSITECYKALSAIHSEWKYIPHEFDDYIAAPKPNKYRSIHTAIYGPKERIVEIQIRTYDMHKEAELGIAAHWVYKEGSQEANYQTKLSWLRQVMDWQQEVAQKESVNDAINVQQIFNEHVYVFTPNGDIFELPKDATPLDFAYYIHSEIGHLCTGAKINGKLAPLTSKLKTGDRVEILTSRNAKPSRDWLIASLGFLNTIRARSKVLNWFKKQSKEDNVIQGQNLLEREIKRLHLTGKLDLKKAASKLRFKTSNDLLAALGSGDLKISTILDALEIEIETEKPTDEILEIAPLESSKGFYTSDINIQGVNNLLIHAANCCKPIPGEEIAGYITIGRGISIHRADCLNLLNSFKLHPERFIKAGWGENIKQKYPADIIINAFDNDHLSRDIKNVLAEEEIKVIKFETIQNKKASIATIKITIEISGANPLSNILNKISNLPNIIEIYRND